MEANCSIDGDDVSEKWNWTKGTESRNDNKLYKVGLRVNLNWGGIKGVNFGHFTRISEFLSENISKSNFHDLH